MKFKWQSFLELSKELKDIGNSFCGEQREASWRTAVSRAYFSVFNIAKEFLRKMGIDVPERGAHGIVRNKFQNSRNLLEQFIGDHLEKLIEKRIKADYWREFTIPVDWQREVEEAIELARKTLEKLREIGAFND